MSFHGYWLAAALFVAATAHAQTAPEGTSGGGEPVPSVRQALDDVKQLEKRKGPADSQRDEKRRTLRQRTALTVAGGVSLGAYQAGFLYYYTRFLQEYAHVYEEARNEVYGEARKEPDPALPPLAPLKVVTGASAGSINALLAAVTACSKRENDPTQSPFWKVWIGVGIAQLRAERRPQRSLLSEKSRDDLAGDLGKLLEDRDRWADAPCSVEVGISATRLTARTVQVGPLMSNSRLTEKFVFQVTKAMGRAPLAFEPVELPGGIDRRFYPRLGWGDRPEIADVTDLLLASSAFPLAFRARTLNYRLYEGPGLAPSKQVSLFIDGGVLDNQPVKLARSLMKWHAPQDDLPEHVYVDTSAVAYGPSGDPQTSIQDASPIGQYQRFLSDYVSVAGQSEFLDAAEDTAFQKRLAVPQRTLPVAGEHLMHFAAFAETVFRRNDFYVGMVDASLFLARNSLQFQMLARSIAPGAPASDSDPLPIVSPEYACYRSRMVTGRERACEGVDPRLLKVLQACLAMKTRILLGDRRADLSDAFFDALEASGFTYDDLARGRRLRAREVRSELRDVLEDGVIAFAGSDDLLTGYVIKSVGREVGNAALLHRGPDHFWALGTSNRRGVDVTWSPALIADRWRPSIALQIFNIDVQSIQYAPGNHAALPPSRPGQRSIDNTPGFGISVGLHPRFTYSVPINAVVQVEFGAGYTGAIRLTSDWSNSFVSLRHGPVASATLLGFERLYVDLSVVDYLDSLNVVADAYRRPDIIPVVGRRTVDVLLGVGWRFY